MIVVAYLWKEEKALRTSCSKAHKEKIFFSQNENSKKDFLSQCCYVLSRAHTGSRVRDILKIEKMSKKCLHNSNKRFFNPLEGSEY